MRDTLGRWVMVEQIPLVQYAELGYRAERYRSHWTLLGLARIVGLCDEVAQGHLPQRTFEWSDVWLNGLGSLGGFMLYRTTGGLNTVWPNETNERQANDTGDGHEL